MAEAKKCDRCGTFYDEYNVEDCDENPNGFATVSIDSKGDYFIYDIKDLCPNCMASFKKWIKVNGKESKDKDVLMSRADYIRSLTDKQLAAYLISKPFNSGWSQVEILGWLRGKFGGREDE